MGPAGMEEMTEQLRGLFGQMGQNKRQTRKLKGGQAYKLLVDEEAPNWSMKRISRQAIHLMEQNGIVFIDEIDKVTGAQRGPRRRGVAPGRTTRLVAPGGGITAVSTKYGVVKPTTSCSLLRAHFLSKPSDLIPELQGPFPDSG